MLSKEMIINRPETSESEWTEHLEELRRRIIAGLLVFSAASVGAFAASDRIAAFLMAPLGDLGIRLYTFNPAEKFVTYLRLSLLTGGMVSAPFLLLQGLLFVWPALRGRERGYTLAALLAVPALFIAGAGGSYWFLAPKVLGFFLRFGGSDGIQPLWGLKEYVGMLYSLMFAAGLLLQTPLLLLLSFITGVTTPETVGRFRPLWIFLIFLAAAICTPPDVVSQIALGVPLYLLFELTLCVGRLLRPLPRPRRPRKKA